MPTHTLITTYTDGGDFSERKSVSTTAPAEINLDITVTAGQTNKLYTIAIDVSQIDSMYLSMDVDAVVKTNSTSSPADTLTLTADEPLIWTENMPPLACPLDTDVTAIYVTNSNSTTAGTGSLRVLFTPA